MQMDFSGKQLEVTPTNDHRRWCMTIDEVAQGYGVDRDTIVKHLQRHGSEFLDGVERGRTICPTPGGPQEKTVLYREGVIKLGFFVRSAAAEAFRRWATDLIVDHLDKNGLDLGTVLSEMRSGFAQTNERLDQIQGEVDELREIVGIILSDSDEKTIRALIREVKLELGMDGRALVGHVRGLLGTSGIYKTQDPRAVVRILKDMLGRGLKSVD